MALAIGALAACALPVFLVSSLALEIKRDLGLVDSQIGGAITAFWIAATLSSFPGGRLVDRLGAVRAVHVAGACVCAGALGIAAIADSYAALVAFLALIGLGNAIVPPAMSAVVSTGLSARRRGTTFGLQQSGPPLASVLAGIALPTVGAALGWRWALAIGALAAVAGTFIVRERDARARVEPAPAAGARAGADAAGAAMVRSGRGRGSAIARVRAGAAGAATATGAETAVRGRGARLAPPSTAPVSRTATALLIAAATLGSAVATGFVTYLVVFAVGAGLSSGVAGALLAVASLICVLTRIALGTRADRVALPRLPAMAALLAIAGAGFALLALPAQGAVVAGALLALGIGWGWTGLYILLAVERSPHAPGRAVGLVTTGTYAGGMAGPLLVGLVSNATSFRVAWIACAAMCALASAAFAAAGRATR